MNAAAAGRPVVIVQVGYLPMTTWPRQAVAERIRYWRANGFAVERIRPGCYWCAPYMIDTRAGGAA